MAEQRVNGLSVHDEGSPSGRPIVFVHAFPLDHTMWRPQTQALAAGFRTLSYDIRGFGRSDIGSGQVSIEFFVDDLVAILDRFKLTRAAVCGLSMGGYVALRAVERHPDRFDALVLCDTRSEADTDEAKVKRSAAIRSVKEGGVEKFAEGFVKNVLCEKTLASKRDVVDTVLKIIHRNSAVGISGALLAMAARTDTTAALKKMNLPALVLVGEHDKLTPPSAAQAMAALLPHAEYRVIPDAAHMSNLENPAFFNGELLGFLKSVHAS